MKKTKTKIGILLLIIGVTIFNACKKDEYQPKGDYGNANISSSTTVTLNSWASDFDDGINYSFSSIVTWSSITQDIKDKGIVMVYANDGSGSWIALPYTDGGDDYYSNSLNFSFKVGSVTIITNGFDDTGSPNPSDYNGLVVRIVAISTASRKANPNVDLKNYNAVKEAFNIKD